MSYSILQNQIQIEIKKRLAANGQNSKSEKELENEMNKQAEKYLNEIEAHLRPSVLRSFLWIFQKIWQKFYDQIIVNESQLSQLKSILLNKDQNVVLVPTHKSYMDSILLGYIHYHYKLEYPFVCGSEAFFALVLIGIIIKSTNGFYYNVQNMKNDIYKAVLDSYICSLMKHNCLIEVFIE